MREIGNFIQRLISIMPGHIKPKFRTWKEQKAWLEEEGRKDAIEQRACNRSARLERAFGRSGIHPLHRNCTFDNYTTECEGQHTAVNIARDYVERFGETLGCFMFSGGVGTGKNHLASAIAAELIRRNHSVMIITVAELFSMFRSTFEKNSTLTESMLMSDFCALDLLILDEVGLQKGSDFEVNLLTQIVDRRQLYLKPTSMLTNKTFPELVDLLGDRLMDRQLNGGVWVPFTWGSFRSRKNGKI